MVLNSAQCSLRKSWQHLEKLAFVHVALRLGWQACPGGREEVTKIMNVNNGCSFNKGKGGFDKYEI